MGSRENQEQEQASDFGDRCGGECGLLNMQHS